MAQIKAICSIDGESGNTKNNNFAWQIGAGISFAASENISLDLCYRYVDYGDFSKTEDWETDKVDVSANEFYLGIRYNF